MKILVSGGAGYIGSQAVLVLLEKEYEVVVLDNLYRGYGQVMDRFKEKYGKKFAFYKADLRDIDQVEKVFKKEKIDGVMHFGALCLVNESMEEPEKYFENNVLGTVNLLRAMKKHRVDKLVFSSTCAVYGESQYLPVDEKHPLFPTNPYGESKLMAEKVIKWMGQIYGIRSVVFRYFNVSGAADDGSIGDSKKPSQLLMQNAVRGALGIEPFSLTCPKVKTKDGTPIRDYVNVIDLVEAHLLGMEYLKKGGKSDIFNLGTGKGNSVLEIVNEVKKVTGKDFGIGKAEARKGEYAAIWANTKKVKNVLRWKTKRKIKDSVESLVKWYEEYPKGWDY
jgi:UDP-glucose 4-epimerase